MADSPGQAVPPGVPGDGTGPVAPGGPAMSAPSSVWYANTGAWATGPVPYGPMPYGPTPHGAMPYGPIPPGAGAPGVNPNWLASSADRERAIGVLRAGYTEGRLSQDELDERISQAYAARTYGELWALTGDLPAGAFPFPSPGPHAYGPHADVLQQPDAEPSTWGPAATLIITALVIFTLAALITAIVTAHAQSGIPLQQHVDLTPYITSRHVPG